MNEHDVRLGNITVEIWAQCSVLVSMFHFTGWFRSKFSLCTCWVYARCFSWSHDAAFLVGSSSGTEYNSIIFILAFAQSVVLVVGSVSCYYYTLRWKFMMIEKCVGLLHSGTLAYLCVLFDTSAHIVLCITRIVMSEYFTFFMHLELKCAHLVIFTNFVDEYFSSSHVNEWISHIHITYIAFFRFFYLLFWCRGACVCWISFRKTQRAKHAMVRTHSRWKTIFRVNNCDVLRYRYASIRILYVCITLFASTHHRTS